MWQSQFGTFSGIALFAWIPISLWLFSKYNPVKAAAWTLLGAMMWLPEKAAFDPPILPAMDKYTIAACMAMIGLKWKSRRTGNGFDWVFWIIFISMFQTIRLNGDSLMYGTYIVTRIPGLTYYDGAAMALRLVFTIAIPLWIGRAMFRSESDLVEVLKVFIFAGLIYSIPIFWELRFSPTLHYNVYGFNPREDWSQNIRAGGFRATVFMGHGLVVAFFMFMSFFCSILLNKMGKKRLFGFSMKLISLYLFAILVMCKSAGPIIYGVVTYTLLNFTSHKAQVRIAAVIGLLVLSYPSMRICDWFPVQGVMDLVSGLGPERAESLQFRFDQEDLLLTKGAERFWFGWGGYSREHVYHKDYGKDMTVQDGYWIAVFGQEGFVGFLGTFGMMLWPLFRVGKALRKLKTNHERTALAGAALMCAFYALNNLPNMPFPNVQFVFAAGLALLSKEMPKLARLQAKKVAAEVPQIDAPRKIRSKLSHVAC